MSMHYQPLNYYPQPPTATADSCCGPACAGFCCAKPACCLEPACCSRVGACPCFCTGSSTAFSLALSAIWTAFLLLIFAISLPDLFVFDYIDNYTVLAQVGMWQVCTSRLGELSCWYYGGDISMNEAYLGLGAAFNAMRILIIIGTVATLATGILAAIRLAFQQRVKPISPTLSRMLLASGAVAVVAVATAWALIMVLYSNFASHRTASARLSPPSLGSVWFVVTTACGLLLIAVPLHIIAHCCYQRKVKLQPSTNSAYSSAVSYPTAAVFAQSPSAVHSSLPPPVEHRPADAPSYHNHPPPAYESVNEHRPSAPPAISYGPVVPPIYLTPGHQTMYESVYENI